MNKTNQVPNKERYNFLIFESLAKTRNYPAQEWIGQVDEDEKTVVINYRNGELKIAIDDNEINARNNLVPLAASQIHDHYLTIEKIIKAIDLKWTLPDGYIEE
ncbi:MAG: hypothetical protein AABY22_15045 [Nanoarchaeota archaeon]